jgi:Raf kinase inhibitor-like YbhB/YbcL family protein
MKKICGLFLIGMILITIPVFGQEGEGVMQKIEVRSSAFGEGERIPSDFTCDGADMSPPIEWSGVPVRAQSLAVIVDDPDATSGNWTHWLVYDLPPDLTQLRAGISAKEKLPGEALQGRTDFGKTGYGGPCPPSGEHRYFFKVYALDAMLRLKSGASKQELLRAMQGHILAEGVLMGRYDRS